MRPFLVCIAGPPGAGKTSVVAELLVTGGTVFRLREAVAASSHLLDVASRHDPLGWVSDAMVAKVLDASAECFSAGPHPVLLDNFPGNIRQLELLAEVAARTSLGLAVIELAVADDIVTARVRARRVCPTCQPDMHTPARSTMGAQWCASCGTPLERRVSDDVERHARRLGRFRTNLRELERSARRMEIPYRRICAASPPDQVHAAAVAALADIIH